MSDNRITAPIGLAKVANVLGEPFLDTGPLCRSAKINPYSLIRPLFRSTSYPKTPPSWFADTQTLGVLVPSALKSQYEGYKDISSLPCASEYQFSTGAKYQYEAMKWGYIVPYVSSPNDIFALKDLIWKRFYPADDTNNEGWCVIDQFDGYIHDAEPKSPIADITLKYGQKISVTPTPINGGWSKEQILGGTASNLNTKGHEGGVVNIPAVMAVNSDYTYGLSIYRRDSSNVKYTLFAHFVGDSVTPTSGQGFSDKYPVFSAKSMNTGYFVNEGQFIVIPWVADKKVTLRQGFNTIIDAPSGTRFFSFRFDEQFEPWAEKTIVPRALWITDRKITYDSSTGKATITFNLMINSGWTNYPLTAEDFLLIISTSEGKVYYTPNGLAPTYSNVNLPSNMANGEIKFPTATGISSTATSATVTVTEGYLPLFGYQVTVTVNVGAVLGYQLSNVTLESLCMTSTDANVGGGSGRISFKRVYSGSSMILDKPQAGILDAVPET